MYSTQVYCTVLHQWRGVKFPVVIRPPLKNTERATGSPLNGKATVDVFARGVG